MPILISKLNNNLAGKGNDEAGKVVFVDGALPREEVEYQVKKKHKKYDIARLTQIVSSPNENRQAVKCKHSLLNSDLSICGGCSLQHIKNEQQLTYKLDNLLELLTHNLNHSNFVLIPALKINSYHYRFRARLGVRYIKAKEEVYIGFREKYSHFLVNLQECWVLAESILKSLFHLKPLVNKLSCYDQIPQIEVASSYGNEQAFNVSYIIRHLREFNSKDLELLKEFSSKHSVNIFSQSSGAESVQKLFPTQTSPFLQYQTFNGQNILQFFPTDFTQINLPANELLLKTITDYLPKGSDLKLLDLFCGIGNFSISLARFFKRVIGVEISTTMCERASKNAELNGYKHLEFMAMDLHEENFIYSQTLRTIQTETNNLDCLLLDPPRNGADLVVKNIHLFQPKQIIYVSCNPASLVRDLVTLEKSHYHLSHIGIIDMFPHTSHVECLAILRKS